MITATLDQLAIMKQAVSTEATLELEDKNGLTGYRYPQSQDAKEYLS